MFRAKLRTRGGIRYGQSYWFAENATWPLVVPEADSEEIVLSYSIFRYRKEIARNQEAVCSTHSTQAHDIVGGYRDYSQFDRA